VADELTKAENNAHLLLADWVLPIASDPIPDGAVLVVQGRIARVGRRREVHPPNGAAVTHLGACALMPALVNCHTHLEYAALPACGDGLPFHQWIANLYLRSQRVPPDRRAEAARSEARRMVMGGVTAVGDCGPEGFAADAMREAQLGGVAFQEVFGIDEREDLEGHMADLRRRVDLCRRSGVRPGVSPHSPYTAGPALLRLVDEYARAEELPVAIHVAESKGEIDRLMGWERVYSLARGRYAIWRPPRTTPIRYLRDLGLLKPGVVCVHCVRVDDEEIDMLAEAGVGVALCPRSNALHGNGLPRIRELMDAGVPVGFGTDGACSVGRADLLEEARFALAAERARVGSADAISSRQVLEAVTLGSARVLGLDGEVGSIEPGKAADLVALQLPGPAVTAEEVFGVVLLGSRGVRMTMRAGRVVWDAAPTGREAELDVGT